MQILEAVQPMWSLQCKEFEGDETGRQFLEYMTLWCDTAERLYEEGNYSDGGSGAVKSLRSCVLEAMEVPEENLGKIDGGFVGPMLMYMINAWTFGEKLGLELSSLEMKMVASAVQQQLAEQAARAEARQEAAVEEKYSDTPSNVSAPGGDV